MSWCHRQSGQTAGLRTVVFHQPSIKETKTFSVWSNLTSPSSFLPNVPSVLPSSAPLSTPYVPHLPPHLDTLGRHCHCSWQQFQFANCWALKKSSVINSVCPVPLQCLLLWSSSSCILLHIDSVTHQPHDSSCAYSWLLGAAGSLHVLLLLCIGLIAFLKTMYCIYITNWM